MTHAPVDPTNGNEPTYSFRPSVLGAPRNFRLSTGAIIWDAGRHSGQVDYARVTRTRMSFRPAGTQNHRFVTEIWSHRGPKLTIVSSSWKSMAEQVRLDSEYRAFITELHRRLLAAGTRARFDSGINPGAFWVGICVTVAAGLGLCGLIVRTMEAHAQTAALLAGIFLAVFVWYAANYFRRNRPGHYRPDALPELLLPTAKS
jgi:hypothetical protein